MGPAQSLDLLSSRRARPIEWMSRSSKRFRTHLTIGLEKEKCIKPEVSILTVIPHQIRGFASKIRRLSSSQISSQSRLRFFRNSAQLSRGLPSSKIPNSFPVTTAMFLKYRAAGCASFPAMLVSEKSWEISNANSRPHSILRKREISCERPLTKAIQGS